LGERQSPTTYGGGIFAANAGLVIVNSTIALNVAGVLGGGVYHGTNDAVVMANVCNTTIAFNDVNPTIVTGGFGGGVYIDNKNGTAHANGGAAFRQRCHRRRRPGWLQRRHRRRPRCRRVRMAVGALPQDFRGWLRC